MSFPQVTRDAFVQEFHSVLSLSSILMDQKDILSIDDFMHWVNCSFETIFPDKEIDRERLFNNLPGYYMVYLAKNWLEKANQPQDVYPANNANKSSERPYLRLVR